MPHPIGPGTGIDIQMLVKRGVAKKPSVSDKAQKVAAGAA